VGSVRRQYGPRSSTGPRKAVKKPTWSAAVLEEEDDEEGALEDPVAKSKPDLVARGGGQGQEKNKNVCLAGLHTQMNKT
jgi:hypothetical protein